MNEKQKQKIYIKKNNNKKKTTNNELEVSLLNYVVCIPRNYVELLVTVKYQSLKTQLYLIRWFSGKRCFRSKRVTKFPQTGIDCLCVRSFGHKYKRRDVSGHVK